ncbi:hypothetical protein [Nocardiopsis quinghaiensis]|uniref:hypothetical protein n=1 Tax=Nocardiopsis quinghaiensis TaxID=464995 RepID=UPI001681995C|nr:hypothetical protein [Nocardiopsis quinghaiensis]
MGAKSAGGSRAPRGDRGQRGEETPRTATEAFAAGGRREALPTEISDRVGPTRAGCP